MQGNEWLAALVDFPCIARASLERVEKLLPDEWTRGFAQCISSESRRAYRLIIACVGERLPAPGSWPLIIFSSHVARRP